MVHPRLLILATSFRPANLFRIVETDAGGSGNLPMCVAKVLRQAQESRHIQAVIVIIQPHVLADGGLLEQELEQLGQESNRLLMAASARRSGRFLRISGLARRRSSRRSAPGRWRRRA